MCSFTIFFLNLSLRQTENKGKAYIYIYMCVYIHAHIFSSSWGGRRKSLRTLDSHLRSRSNVRTFAVGEGKEAKSGNVYLCAWERWFWRAKRKRKTSISERDSESIPQYKSKKISIFQTKDPSTNVNFKLWTLINVEKQWGRLATNKPSVMPNSLFIRLLNHHFAIPSPHKKSKRSENYIQDCAFIQFRSTTHLSLHLSLKMQREKIPGVCKSFTLRNSIWQARNRDSVGEGGGRGVNGEQD